jgi:hypothetical protein
VAIYRGSSPFFDRVATTVTDFMGKYLVQFFENMDFLLLFTFLVGIFFSNMVFLRVANRSIIAADINATDELQRAKKQHHRSFRIMQLKDEHRVGIFLLAALNLTLLIVNTLDIYWVWFNFKWNGSYLKQFVHEGTYLLLLSILCSIIIVLFYFRGNLNFYNRNSLLRKLSYIWLAQNAVLTISVAIRNLHYIDHFALAYKRVGLCLFLLLTLFGLFTVYRKVSKKKSTFYLLRSNAFAFYVVLIVSSTINWENVIARYNFSHADKAFVELAYLATFPDKSLPYLDKSDAEIIAIKNIQKVKYPFEELDMSAEEYSRKIENRRRIFIRGYESKNILSWNWPEYSAYQKMR